MNWYYLKNDRQFGPVPEKSIRAWLDSGFLESGDLVWSEGMQRWSPVAEVPALGGEPSPSTRPAPPPDPLWTGPEPTATHPTPSVASYAGFAPRALAYFVDVMLVSLVLTLVWLPRISDPALDPETLFQNRGFMVSAYLSTWFYFAILESSPWQATLGKRLLRLRVTNMEGHRIGFLQASLRQLGKVLSALPLQAGFLLAIFTPKKQALHDIITGCLVLRS